MKNHLKNIFTFNIVIDTICSIKKYRLQFLHLFKCFYFTKVIFVVLFSGISKFILDRKLLIFKEINDNDLLCQMFFFLSVVTFNRYCSSVSKVFLFMHKQFSLKIVVIFLYFQMLKSLQKRDCIYFLEKMLKLCICDKYLFNNCCFSLTINMFKLIVFVFVFIIEHLQQVPFSLLNKKNKKTLKDRKKYNFYSYKSV